MRILLTTDTVGGVWTFTQELCAGLLERGHAVALVSLGRAPSDSQQAWFETMFAQNKARFRYRSLDVPLEWMDENAGAYRWAEAELLQTVEEFQVELLHFSQFCFGALPVALPKVVTAHSDVLSWAEACRPTGLEDTEWLRQYCALVDAGLSGANGVVAPTRWMAEALGRGFASAGDVMVIYNGRSLPCIAGVSRVRRLQAVSAGRRWDEAKGLGMLDGIEAAMPVMLAGDTQLENADGAGCLSQGDLLSLFTKSSVYIAASMYEPFGLAPLEAALCGCAVLANDIESLHEVWRDGALYFRGQEQLKAVLARLTASEDDLRSAQLRSGARAAELSASAMVESYLDLYESLLGGTDQRVRGERLAYAG